MQVSVNLSEVYALTDRAEKELGNVPQVMKAAVGMGAAFERSTHAYRNRTFKLQRSTREKVVSRSARLTRVDFEMGYNPSAPYASYIVNRGLSNFTDAAMRVKADLEDEFEKLGHRIVK